MNTELRQYIGHAQCFHCSKRYMFELAVSFWGKVIFHKCLSFCSQGGMRDRGCVHARGCARLGVVCGGRRAIQGGGGMRAWGVHAWGYMAGGHAWWGVCMAGGRGECVAGKTATAVVCTHPTGMHSCMFMIFQQQLIYVNLLYYLNI